MIFTYFPIMSRDTDRKQRNIRNNTEEEWEEVVQIYRENKR